MMRIIAGERKGQKLAAPKTEETRPISDRAKEAFFAMLGDIEGLSILDAYAGSGSVGLEALSRGAASATFVDSAEVAIAACRENAATLGYEEQTRIEKVPIIVWLSEHEEQFDIVFADPPFPQIEDAPLVRLAGQSRRVFAYKHPRRHKPHTIPGFSLARSRRYGDSMVSVYIRD